MPRLNGAVHILGRLPVNGARQVVILRRGWGALPAVQVVHHREDPGDAAVRAFSPDAVRVPQALELVDRQVPEVRPADADDRDRLRFERQQVVDRQAFP